jgi:uncharacterized membrane protein
MATYNYDPALSSVRTEITIAWIFALIGLIIDILLVIFGLAEFIALASIPYIGLAAAGIFIAYVIIGIIFLIPTILVYRRTAAMRRAANAGDIETLKRLNSIGYGIVALIFGWVITGIFLLIAHGAIENLGRAPQVYQLAQAQPETVNIEKLEKLKSLLDSGAISKEEYETQKNKILHGSSSSSIEDQLMKLKQLYESGAISREEYDAEKKKLLEKM